VGRRFARRIGGDGAEPWKEFSISKIFRDGLFVGWGGNCGKHCGKTACKKALTFGSGPKAISEEEGKVRIKQWLLMGRALPAAATNSRSKHIAIDARTFELWSVDEIEAA